MERTCTTTATYFGIDASSREAAASGGPSGARVLTMTRLLQRWSTDAAPTHRRLNSRSSCAPCPAMGPVRASFKSARSTCLVHHLRSHHTGGQSDHAVGGLASCCAPSDAAHQGQHNDPDTAPPCRHLKPITEHPTEGMLKAQGPGPRDGAPHSSSAGPARARIA